jgi:hypothetical protein
MRNYIDDLFEAMDTPKDGRHFLILGSRVRFTTAGVRRFKERFARAGFDIAKIRRIDQFEAALVGSFHVEQAAIEAWFKRRHGGKTDLESTFAVAVMCGDDAEARRLRARLERRREVAMQLVSNPPKKAS